jgi:hypothetical protein
LKRPTRNGRSCLQTFIVISERLELDVRYVGEFRKKPRKITTRFYDLQCLPQICGSGIKRDSTASQAGREREGSGKEEGGRREGGKGKRVRQNNLSGR